MVKGFQIDYSHAAKFQAQWIEGEPEPNDVKLFGLVDVGFPGVKTCGHPRFAVTTYRCAKCGYLESYAVHKIIGDSMEG